MTFWALLLDKKNESVTLDGLMQRRPTLSYRIFLVSILFLLVPLLIVSTFLYRNDLESHRQTTLLHMQSLSFKSSIYIHDIIHEDLLYLYQLGQKVPKNPNLYPTLQAQIEKIKPATLLLLFQSNDNWVCKWSSNEQFVNQTFNDAKFIQKSTQQGFSSSRLGKELIVSWFFPDPDKSSESYLLAMIIPWNTLLEKLQLQSPYILSILDENHTVIATTNSSFLGKNIPVKNEAVFHGENYSLFFEPIEDTPFSLMVGANQGALFGKLVKSFALEVGLVFGFVVLLGLVLTIFFTRKLAKPLRDLRLEMKEVEAGNFDTRFMPSKFGFELNDLGAQFNQMLDHLQENIQRAKEEKERRVQIASELKVARQIQDTLFPVHIPTIPFSIDCTFEPAKEVGGDFYDVYLAKDRILIAIADSAGKGVFASLFSHSLRSILRALSPEKEFKELVKTASFLYYEDAKTMHMFTTAFISFLDPKTKKFSYCSLGHLPAMLLRDNELQELTNDNLALGLKVIQEPQVSTLQLQEGDLLFFYSDGLTEQTNSKNQAYTKSRVIDILRSKLDQEPKKINELLLEDLISFQGEQVRLDDITFITIKI